VRRWVNLLAAVPRVLISWLDAGGGGQGGVTTKAQGTGMG
jgi:hypothetical protein